MFQDFMSRRGLVYEKYDYYFIYTEKLVRSYGDVMRVYYRRDSLKIP
jgi:hypothetical protein